MLYPDAGIACYTSTGEEKWKIDLPPFRSMHGIGSSLMIVDGLVIVVADQLADSYMAAYRAENGKQVWKSDRLDGVTGGYSTPSIYHAADGSKQLVVAGPLEVALQRAH